MFVILYCWFPGKRQKHVVLRCMDCGTVKRFIRDESYKLRSEQAEAWLGGKLPPHVAAKLQHVRQTPVKRRSKAAKPKQTSGAHRWYLQVMDHGYVNVNKQLPRLSHKCVVIIYVWCDTVNQQLFENGFCGVSAFCMVVMVLRWLKRL